MRALGNTIIFEPIWQDMTAGGLHHGSRNRYPATGWAVSVGAGCVEDIEPGDFIVLDDHGAEAMDESVDTVMLRLQGDGEEVVVRVPVEVEPVLRENYAAFLANPSTHDTAMAVENLETGEVVSFWPRDILDVMSGNVTNLGNSLSYRHVTELPGDSGLFVVAEREILFRIAGDDCV